MNTDGWKLKLLYHISFWICGLVSSVLSGKIGIWNLKRIQFKILSSIGKSIYSTHKQADGAAMSNTLFFNIPSYCCVCLHELQ